MTGGAGRPASLGGDRGYAGAPTSRGLAGQLVGQPREQSGQVGGLVRRPALAQSRQAGPALGDQALDDLLALGRHRPVGLGSVAGPALGSADDHQALGPQLGQRPVAHRGGQVEVTA